LKWVLDTAIVRVRDLQAAKSWYEEKLGLQVVFTTSHTATFPEAAAAALSAALQVVFTTSHTATATFGVGEQTSLTLEDPGPGVQEKRPRGGEPTTYPVLYAPAIKHAHEQLCARGIKVGAL
jgi:catechol 2,3-dioxygenase-like lactoylglutathione lyase family enzyme